MAELTIGEIARGLWSVGLPVFLMGLIIYALNQRMYVHYKELQASEERNAKLEARCVKLEELVFRVAGVTDKLASSVEVVVKK